MYVVLGGLTVIDISALTSLWTVTLARVCFLYIQKLTQGLMCMANTVPLRNISSPLFYFLLLCGGFLGVRGLVLGTSPGSSTYKVSAVHTQTTSRGLSMLSMKR